MLPKLRTGQLEDQVYHALKEAILSGRFRSGDALVENKLAEALGTSNTPVRAALARLANEGLVASEAYRGHRVATLSTEDVRHICEIRKLLQGHIVAQLARERPPEVVARLEEAVEKAEQAFARGDREESTEHVRSFEKMIIDSAANPYISGVLSNLLERLFLIGIASTTEGGRQERSLAEHAQIVEGITSGAPEEARRALERHVDSIFTDYSAMQQRAQESTT